MTRGSRRLVFVGIVLLGCASTEPRPEASVEPRDAANPNAEAAQLQPRAEHRAVEAGPEATSEIDPRFEATLLAVAGEYRDWKAVDDEYRFAPTLCRIPMAGRLHWSESDDASTHGSKLYMLYAKDPVAYGWPPTFEGIGGAPVAEQPAATGEIRQAIVKESFAAVAHDAEGRSPAGIDLDPLSGRRPALREGTLYSAGEALDLYVMIKLAPDTPGTDAGWVYGTLTADGATVTSAGRVESCMGCHEAAPHDRLFGRKAAPHDTRPAANAAPR